MYIGLELAEARSMVKKIGASRRNYIGVEFEGFRFIEYSHYEKKNRQHMWKVECKHCGEHYVRKPAQLKTLKSCGCIKTRTKSAIEADMVGSKWLKVAWI